MYIREFKLAEEHARAEMPQDLQSADADGDLQQAGDSSWKRRAKQLIELLVEAVLTMPEPERKQIISQTMTLLFDAALTLPEIPGDGLLALLFAAGGYQDYLSRLWSPKDKQIETAPAVVPACPHTTLELGETRNVT
jgi:hypothetical protein